MFAAVVIMSLPLPEVFLSLTLASDLSFPLPAKPLFLLAHMLMISCFCIC